MAADRIEVPFTLSWAWPVVVASSALACAVCYFAVIDVSCAQPLAIPGLCGGVGIALALACVIAPILCVIAWNRPLVLFALTAATAPTYNVFTVGYFGTLTKVCGLATVVALAFYLTRRPAPASIPRSLWAWLAFVAYAVSTLLWAPDSRAAWEPLGSMLQLFALYAAVSLALLRCISTHTVARWWKGASSSRLPAPHTESTKPLPSHHRIRTTSQRDCSCHSGSASGSRSVSRPRYLG